VIAPPLKPLFIALITVGTLLAGPTAVYASPKEPAMSLPDLSPDQQLAALAWLAGTWRSDTYTAHYSSPEGGLILSYSKQYENGRLVFFEQERFEVRGGRVVEAPSPKGVPSPVVFTLTTLDLARHEAVFENPTHDFPTRLSYRREGDRLHIRVEGPDGRGFGFALDRVAAEPAR
jgi:hypothetical protein